MESKPSRRVRRCPICGGPVPGRDAPCRPFCSERCKLQDLGKWVSGRYFIPGPPLDHAEDAGAEEAPEKEDDEQADG